MKPLFAACFLVLTALASPQAGANADAAWGKVTALDAGPGRIPTNREEAQTIALQFLQTKEETLRQFLAAHPADPRATEALIRLTHVLTSQSDFSGQPALYQKAVAMLDQAFALASKAGRREEMAHLAFTKLSLTMRRVDPESTRDHDRLLSEARAFERQFPSDTRLGALYAEVATLYDDQPRKKQELLLEAHRHARTDEVKARIADDMKRLALLGKPVSIKGKDLSGATIDSGAHKGKVVVVYFYAGFSPGSLDGLAGISALRAAVPASKVEIIGVSIDPTADAARAVMQAKGVSWPVIWEEKGWLSPLLRNYAINAIPTTWVLDRTGALRTLNARGDNATRLVQALLRE